MIRSLANTAWQLRCFPAARALDAALADPALAQKRILRSILHRNSRTEFGRQYHFEKISSPQSYQDHVPEQSYESHEPMIQKIATGETNILTADPVLMFEPSSGSTSAAKWIPYTTSLRAEYQRAIRPWIYDILTNFPAIRRGTSYWSISPLSRTGPSKTTGGIPIGFGSDTEYLGRFERWAAAQSFAVPPQAALTPDLDACLEFTCEHLRAARDLAFISVWSPTFLELILDRLGADAAELWPNLTLVSSWADASAAPAAEKLQKRFPNIPLQPKGLLATEGVVTIPLSKFGGSKVLAVNSHFYEFVPDDGTRPRLAHELKIGAEYTVLLTTGGGLYRYRLGDRVRVTDFAKATPTLEFIGREGGVSDLCGEKLNPAFVAKILADLPTGTFAMLAPADTGNAYILFAESHADPIELDAALKENPHYAYARQIGQLAPARVIEIDRNAAASHLARCVSLGIRAGDVKPPSLDTRRGWESWFGPHIRKRKEVLNAQV